MTNSDDQFIRWCRIIARLHAEGATIRAIARAMGESRSTLHRQLPAILAIAAEPSQMGQANTAHAVETPLP